MPEQTILIENPVAVTKNAESPETARAFVDFLREPVAQRVFAAKGYRPVLKDLADPGKYPVPGGLFRIDDVGGWEQVNARFFHPESGILAEIERDLGVSAG